MFVVEDEGAIVGWADTDPRGARVAVHPDHEGRGVGTLLRGAVEARIAVNAPQSYDTWCVEVGARSEPEFRLALDDEEGLVAAAVGERWEDGVGYVAQLAVARRARGRGHGRALLLALFAAFRREGLAVVDLSVAGTNAQATGLYESAGMEPDYASERWELRGPRVSSPAMGDLADTVRRALEEDVGGGDVTSLATVPAGARAIATITQKADGVLFGLDVAEATFRALDPGVTLERLGPEGEWRAAPAQVLRATGDARALLAAERTALNFLQRLSGVATLTARYVRAIEGTGARILDTRKTTPGLRALEKAAVAAGGGVNHRVGLHDMVLIKENHAALAGGVGPAVRAARAAFPGVPLEVECRHAGGGRRGARGRRAPRSCSTT